ncbi:hypothetical protein AJ80_04883 [Polytolypa hystricis UAMH7299]|uniref:AttH domain-containing protein n=1 Tax=Polytolypa hystricis (strain UAMH7299) TaxID=1447883 RepID=A0A2B7Y858_POLH7|nr:hypothetical protein AJ80_04883 [Polytolypa hystricis UAMH7299]
MAPYISHVLNDSVIDGVPGSPPYKHAYFPIYETLSKSHWELWLFDAVDPSTNAAVTMTFFRDGSLLGLGKSPLRTTFHVALPDGNTIHGEHLAKESIIEANSERVMGRWESLVDGQGSAQFEVSLDLSQATVTFDLPILRGMLKLQSSDVLSHRDSFDPADKDHVLSPRVHYLHAIPRAVGEIDFTFPLEDKSLRFSGLAGSEHCWMEDTTPALMEGCTYVRGHAGPYTVCLFRIFSRVEPGKTYVKTTLVEDGKEVFSSTTADSVSLTDDYVSFRNTVGGQVRGGFADNASGYRIDIVSPSAHRHWSFELKHQLVWWSMPTGPKTGNNGFVDLLSGGEVGGPVYSGRAAVGHVELSHQKTEYKGFNSQD